MSDDFRYADIPMGRPLIRNKGDYQPELPMPSPALLAARAAGDHIRMALPRPRDPSDLPADAPTASVAFAELEQVMAPQPQDSAYESVGTGDAAPPNAYERGFVGPVPRPRIEPVASAPAPLVQGVSASIPCPAGALTAAPNVCNAGMATAETLERLMGQLPARDVLAQFRLGLPGFNLPSYSKWPQSVRSAVDAAARSYAQQPAFVQGAFDALMACDHAWASHKAVEALRALCALRALLSLIVPDEPVFAETETAAPDLSEFVTLDHLQCVMHTKNSEIEALKKELADKSRPANHYQEGVITLDNHQAVLSAKDVEIVSLNRVIDSLEQQIARERKERRQRAVRGSSDTGSATPLTSTTGDTQNA